MRKNGFIVAGVTLMVFMAVLFVVVPETMRDLAPLLGIIAAAVALPVGLGVVIGLSMRRRYDERFRRTLEGLPLAFERFYGILYAYGEYRGKYLAYKYSRVAKGDFMPQLPGATALVLLCRIKIPGTENRRLHCAVFSDAPNMTLRKALGWTNPEPGFLLYKMKGQGEGEMLDVFSRLRTETRAKLRELADRGGSCGIASDWETVMIGKDNALRLLNGNQAALAWLDLQVKIPSNASREEFVSMLDTALAAADELAADLGEWG